MIKDLDDLYAFLEQWYEDVSISLGLSEDKIPSFIPGILRNFYMNIGALTEEMPEIAEYSDQNLIPLAQLDCIMSPSELKLDVDGFIVFGWENQGNWTVAVRQDSGDDIYLKGDNGENWDRFCKFTKCKSTLTDFLITQTLAETVILSAKEWYSYSEGQIEEFRMETPSVLWKTSFPPFDMMEVNNCARAYYVSETGNALRFLNPEWGARKSEIYKPFEPLVEEKLKASAIPQSQDKPSKSIIMNEFGGTVSGDALLDITNNKKPKIGFIARLFGKK